MILFPELKTLSNFILIIYIVNIQLEYYLNCQHIACSTFPTLTLSFHHCQLLIFHSKIKKKTDFIIIFLLQFSFTNSCDQLLWVMHFKIIYTIYTIIYTACHQRCSAKKGVLKNFTKFTRKHLCQSLTFNKVARPATLFKKGLWHRSFPVNFAKFLRTLFLQNTSGRLLLALWKWGN